jgi:glycosyltransferase involved in cell wall biosynthesis
MAEAIIEKLPVIAAKTEESLEYSRNGALALLFEMNDMASFENAVSELDSHYSRLKRELSMFAVELKEKFSREQNSQRLMSVLEVL